MDKETINADAEPIETEVVRESGLDALVVGIADEAAQLAAEYQPREILTDDDYKQSKRERAGARKDIAALKSRYDEGMRAIKDAIREADARTKAALAPLDAIDGGYKAEVDAYEERWKAGRRAMLAEEYEGFAPDLVPLVPFERLMARFGSDKGAQWDARSTGESKAIEAMQAAVESIAKDEQTIDSSPYADEDKAALKADYFSTLDLSGALRRRQEAKEQMEKVADLEKGREERFRTSMTPTEYAQACEEVGTPLSQRSKLLKEVATAMGSPAPGEVVPDYVFAGYGNAAQAEAFIAFCNKSGVRRRLKIMTHGKPYKLAVDNKKRG